MLPAMNDGAAALVIDDRMTRPKNWASHPWPMGRIRRFCRRGSRPSWASAPSLLPGRPWPSRPDSRGYGPRSRPTKLSLHRPWRLRQDLQLRYGPRSTSTAAPSALGHPVGASGARILVTLLLRDEAARRMPSTAWLRCASAAAWAAPPSSRCNSRTEEHPLCLL